MPIKTGGGLETVTLVLTQRQTALMREIVEERRTDAYRINLSDIARELVEIGLSTVPRAIAPAAESEQALAEAAS